MDVLLTQREIELILGWKSEPFWPDEERVRSKLSMALGKAEPLSLSRVQLKIIRVWIEEEVEGHYGGGAVVNPEQHAVLRKLDAALDALE